MKKRTEKVVYTGSICTYKYTHIYAYLKASFRSNYSNKGGEALLDLL